MSLFETIKAENIAALKAGDKTKRATYTLLLGEVGRTGDPKAVPSDLEVVTAASKIIAGINEMIAKGSVDAALPEQKAILEQLLPKQAAEEDIIAFLGEYVAANAGLNMKDMRSVMDAVKEHFNGGIDGKLVSGLVRAVLQK